MAELIERYIEKVISQKKGAVHEEHQARALLRDFPELAAKRLADLETPDFVAWRDARLKTVTAATVLRNINWLRHVFRLARQEWKWMEKNPLMGLTLPRQPTPRDRRVSPAEVRNPPAKAAL